MNAVGIDVSKRKSTVTIRQPGDVILMQPKLYLVYMTAGANKFLRIYYGTVREYLKGKGLWSETQPEPKSDPRPESEPIPESDPKPELEPKSKEVNPD